METFLWQKKIQEKCTHSMEIFDKNKDETTDNVLKRFIKTMFGYDNLVVLKMFIQKSLRKVKLMQ